MTVAAQYAFTPPAPSEHALQNACRLQSYCFASFLPSSYTW